MQGRQVAMINKFLVQLLLFAFLVFGQLGPAWPDRAELSAGPWHPECSEAFKALPIDKQGRAIEPLPGGKTRPVDGLKLPEHYKQYAAAYTTYDRACFLPWSELTRSKSFIEANGGVIFEDNPDAGLRPICSGFLTSPSRVMTASHCVKSYPMHFRPYSKPSEKYEFKSLSQPNNHLGSNAADVTDYAVLELETPVSSADWHLQDVERASQSRQAIAIIAISLPMYHILDLNPEIWMKAVRFTRVYSSQLWSNAEIDNPLKFGPADSECLFHQTPTFPGMSGAPIIGVRRTDDPDKPKFFLFGMHLRNGFLTSSDPQHNKAGMTCGNQPKFNIGIKIPERMFPASPR